jgi:hypothetical protein
MSTSGGIEPFSSMEVKKVKAIQFGLINQEKLVRINNKK